MLDLHCFWGLLSSCGVRVSHCSGFFSCGVRALGHTGLSGCSARAQALQPVGSGAQAQQFCCRMVLVAPRHVGSSWLRDQTHVFCIGK